MAKRGASSKRAPSKRGRTATRNPRPSARARTKARRATIRPRLLSWLPRPSPRVTLIGLPLIAAALAAGYLGWFRDSSLVAVRDVQVKGVSTADGGRITAALTDAARAMTTLHFSTEQLEASVKAFPTVASVSADPSFPNGVEIEVTERPPALIASSGGQAVPVAGDGTLLRGLELGDERERLAEIAVRELPAAGRLTGEPLAQAVIVGAAPEPMRPLIEKVSYSEDAGVEVVMKGEIPIRFGTAAAAAEKWAAAAAVLADPRLKTLTYVDVRVPERPAVGGAGAPAFEETSAPPVDAVTSAPDAAVTTADPAATAPTTTP